MREGSIDDIDSAGGGVRSSLAHSAEGSQSARELSDQGIALLRADRVAEAIETLKPRHRYWPRRAEHFNPTKFMHMSGPNNSTLITHSG